MTTFGLNLASSLFITAILAFLFNAAQNFILIIISLELILLSFALFFLHLSFLFDDLIGATLSLFLLPLAGAESALALALFIAIFPIKGSLQFS